MCNVDIVDLINGNALVVDDFGAMQYLEIMAFSGGRPGMLYHYTTFDALMAILSDKSFRLSRLDLMNDKAEARICNIEKAKTQYVMSTTCSTESVSMWKLYGKASGVKVRLGFDMQELIKIVNKFKNDDEKDINANCALRVDSKGYISKETYNEATPDLSTEERVQFALKTHLLMISFLCSLM